MFTIVPLADDEPKKYENATLYIRSKECGKYDHIWFSEIGKLLYMKDRFKNIDDQFSIAFIQNRRYFKNLDQLKLNSKNEVILAPLEYLDSQSILTQFWFCHRKCFDLYKSIVIKNFKEELYEARYMSPHNIFCADIQFCKEYCHWLELNLEPYFDCYSDQKYGAWMCERFLHLFAHSYFNVKTSPIKVLRKD